VVDVDLAASIYAPIDLGGAEEIQNVLAMNEPQHMLSKLFWEVQELMQSQSVWKENDSFPTPIFFAFNAAVTAWHITDWLWQSNAETRAVLAKRYKFEFHEDSAHGLRLGLERFQKAVTAHCRALHVCQQIANGSKHMRTTKHDPKVQAKAEWTQAVEHAGLVAPGDLVLEFTITDGDQTLDATLWFIEAAGYWEQLFNQEKLFTPGGRLPDNIIRATK
jgi:hypothetical protein